MSTLGIGVEVGLDLGRFAINFAIGLAIVIVLTWAFALVSAVLEHEDDEQ